MPTLEYRAIAAKTVYKDGEIHVTHACEGGQTVRMIYRGTAALLGIMQTVKVDLLQIEDAPGE
jgi:hypothetical protein